MLVSKRLIYLELHKTGCTHIGRLLSELIDIKRVGNKHSRMPSHLQNTKKYIVASIRNPWDWYLSLWAYGCITQGSLEKKLTRTNFRDAFKSTLLRFPDIGFEPLIAEINKPKQVWRDTYLNVNDPQAFRRWLNLLFTPERKYDLASRYGDSNISNFAGFLTYRYLRLTARDLTSLYKPDYLTSFMELQEFDAEQNILNATIKNENLEADLLQVLQDCNYDITSAQIKRIYSYPKTNQSQHQGREFYYDRQTLELVAQREKLIIDKYSYSLK